MARIGIIGSEGRMGRVLVEAIAAAGEIHAGGIDKGGDAARACLALVHLKTRFESQ